MSARKGAYGFALPPDPESHEVPLATSPTAQQGANGGMLPPRSDAVLRRGSGIAVHAHRADPALMTPEARIAELGAILATGVRRFLLRQKPVDEIADLEPSCDSMVNSTGSIGDAR